MKNFFLNNKGTVTGPFDVKTVEKNYLNKKNIFILFSDSRTGPWIPISKFNDKVIVKEKEEIEQKSNLQKEQKLKEFYDNKENFKWYWVNNMGYERGPLNYCDLVGYFQSGTIHRKTKIRPDYKKEWSRFDTFFPELCEGSREDSPDKKLLVNTDSRLRNVAIDKNPASDLPTNSGTQRGFPGPSHQELPMTPAVSSSKSSQWGIFGFIAGMVIGSRGRPWRHFFAGSKDVNPDQQISYDDEMLASDPSDDDVVGVEGDIDSNDNPVEFDSSGSDLGTDDFSGDDTGGGFFGGGGDYANDDSGGGFFGGGGDFGGGDFGGGGDW